MRSPSFPVALLLFLLLFPLLLPAQETDFRQTLLPKEIYVGDTAQLSCSFQSPIDFYAAAQSGVGASRVEGGILYFDGVEDYFASMQPFCTVTQLTLRQVGMTYTLALSFIPWRPGRLDFIPLDMEKLCAAPADRVITLEPVEVLSLSQKLGEGTLRPPAPPLLLPGTNYIVWSLIVVAVLLLVLLALLLLNFSAVVKRAVLYKERFGYRRNAFQTKRKLKALLKTGCSDPEFAQEWQRILRSYLDYRFNSSFFSVTAKDIAGTVARATGDMLDIEQENAVLSLQSLFVRTDYIRYAKGSPDSRKLPSQEHEAAFAPGEREQIAELTAGSITDLECEREEFKNYGRV